MGVQLSILLKEVYGSDAARDLLLLVTQAKGPVGYSVARRRLAQHAQTFERAVRTLERLALIGRRMEKTSITGQYSVSFEPTATGRSLVAFFHEVESDASKHLKGVVLPSHPEVAAGST